MEGLYFDGLKKLKETCTIHDIPLLSYAGRVACPECQKERLEQKEEEYRKKMTLQHHKRITYDRLYKDSLISDITLKDASFQTYDIDDKESRINKEKARQVAGRYLKREVFNTVFAGNPGTGKSHLAMSILRAVNENADPWRSCLFLSFDEWLLSIRGTYRKDNISFEDEQSILDRTAAVDLLVIDDIGAETGFIGTTKTATDFTQRMLYGLLNRRQDKSTIITTNLTSDQMGRMYDGKIISRMYRGVEKERTLITFEETTDKRIEKIQF